MKKNLRNFDLDDPVTTVLLGVIYPLVGDRTAQLVFPKQANGELDHAERKDCRLAPDRPAIFLAGIFPLASIGGGHRLRRRQRRWLKPRAHQ